MEDHMILETERLILRRYRREDLRDLAEYPSDVEERGHPACEVSD